MAKIYTRKDSPYYWCLWKRPDGTRARQKTGCPVAPNNVPKAVVKDYEDNAQLKANKLEADDYKDYNPHKERNRLTLYFFDDLMLKYIEERKPGKAHMNCIKRLYGYFTGYCLNDRDEALAVNESSQTLWLDAETVTQYKRVRRAKLCNGKPIAEGTIRRELSTLSSAINYARREWNWKIPNAIEGRKPKSGKPRIVWATHEEAARLIDAAKKNRQAPHLVDFIELGLHTGMRKMEMLACELSRIDLRNEVIHLSPKDQKNSQYGSIPLNRQAKKVILRRLSFIKQHCPNTLWLFPLIDKVKESEEKGERHILDIKTAFRKACIHADTPHLFPHALRHTFCSWLLQAGVSIYLVKDCMRHASITQTEAYGHLVPKNRRDSVSKLDDVLSSGLLERDLSRNCHANQEVPVNATVKTTKRIEKLTGISRTSLY